MNDMDKLHIALYGIDGSFQGYLQHVSVYKQRVEATQNKMEAKHYAKEGTALGDCVLVDKITRGYLRANIV